MRYFGESVEPILYLIALTVAKGSQQVLMFSPLGDTELLADS